MPAPITSYERTRIEDSLWNAILRVARDGNSVFDVSVDEAVEEWKILLHFDDKALTTNEFKRLLLPTQDPDPRGPAVVDSPLKSSVFDHVVATIGNVDVPVGDDENERRMLKQRTRNEINSIASQDFGVESAHDFVLVVRDTLARRLSDTTIQVFSRSPDRNNTVGNDEGENARQDGSQTEEEEEEAMPSPDIAGSLETACRPEPDDVDHEVASAMFVDRGERMTVDIRPRASSCLSLPAPNWIPNASTDIQMCSMNLPMNVFLPEVSDAGREITFSNSKTLLDFSWPSTKVRKGIHLCYCADAHTTYFCPRLSIQTRDMASLFVMIESAKIPHARSAYTPPRNDPVSLFSHLKWESLSLSKRAAIFKDRNIHLRNRPGIPHPWPVCPHITSWDEAQFGAVFDIFARVDAEDQTWLPGDCFPSNASSYALSDRDTAMNVPRKMLYDRLTKLDIPIPVPVRPTVNKDIAPWHGVLSQSDDQIPIRTSASVRELEEQHSGARDRLATVEQFLYCLRRADELSHQHANARAGVLFLKRVPFRADFPDHGLDSAAPFSTSNHAGHRFATLTPSDDLRFAQLMSPTAMARTSMAPHGLAQHIRLVLGMIAVFVGVPDCEDVSAICTTTAKEEDYCRDPRGRAWTTETRCTNGPEPRSYRPYFSVLNGYLDETLNWNLVVMRPGDDLILRPGTPYAMVALEPSFVVCGYFYSARALQRTMMAMVMHHYYGHLSIADDKLSISTSRAGVLLVKMLNHCQKVLKRQAAYQSTGQHLPDDSVQAFCMDDLTSLIVIIGNLHQLDASIGLDDHEFDQDDEDGSDREEPREDNTSGLHRTRRLPRPRALSAENASASGTPVYRQDNTLIIDLKGNPSVWQFSVEFKHDYLHTITEILPSVFDVLIATGTNADRSKLKASARLFKELTSHFEDAATIRERDRSVKDHDAFNKQILYYLDATRQRRTSTVGLDRALVEARRGVTSHQDEEQEPTALVQRGEPARAAKRHRPN